MRRFGATLALTLAALLVGALPAAAQEAVKCTKLENHLHGSHDLEAGNDHVSLGPGNDTIQGGRGNDEVEGGGADEILGGVGDDMVVTMTPDVTPQLMDGGPQNDTVIGSHGDDPLFGDIGQDMIS